MFLKTETYHATFFVRGRLAVLFFGGLTIGAKTALKNVVGIDAYRNALNGFGHDIGEIALDTGFRDQPSIHQALIAIDGARFKLH